MKNFIGSFDESMLQNVEEFEKRYVDTWLELSSKVTGVKDAFYCYGFTDGKIKFSNPTYGDIFVSQNTDIEVTPILLNNRMVNIGTQALYLFRSPVRRNQRSLSSKNTLLARITKYPFSRMGATVSLDYNDIRSCLYPAPYPSINTAMHINPDTSMAVSEDYAIVKDRYGMTYLWYRVVPIGHMDKGVMLVDGHYLQEFSDFCRDHNVKNFYFREDV